MSKTQDHAPATPGQITLETPIKRAAETIEHITLRKPASGELRGIKLFDLLQLDVGALITLLPRITSPTLTPHEVAAMDVVDLVATGTAVTDFFVPKNSRTESPGS